MLDCYAIQSDQHSNEIEMFMTVQMFCKLGVEDQNNIRLQSTCEQHQHNLTSVH
jgi:hypothetical protein